MKTFLLRLLATGAALAVLGFLIAASGIVPIRASSGHWAITERFLQFSKRRSVATHSIGIRTPPLDDRRLVVRGAGHYQTGCLPCHGGPGDSGWEPSESMTPDPPPLSLRVSAFDAAELFYIVKHGIKFTGMPAWPRVHRDDEIWAMVAFMLELPDLRRREYLALAFGEMADSVAGAGTPNAPDDPVRDCARCHGIDGGGRDGAFPVLAGQSAEYLAGSLAAYARGARHSGIMESAAADLDEAAIRRIAAHYAAAVPVGRTPAAADSAVARGGAIARLGVPARRIPSCMDCHGPAPWPRSPHYPSLAGQPADYLEGQLRLFREDRRGGTPYHTIMATIARTLTPAEIADVARYYASLPR